MLFNRFHHIRIIFIYSLVLTLSACAAYSPSIPQNYNGPTATISDSFSRQTSGRAHFFYLSAIEGRPVTNAFSKSADASYGMGSKLTTIGESRKVEARTLKLTIAGIVYSSAPIAGIANSGKNYSVIGEIAFTPESNQTYIIKGDLNGENSFVWIEDLDGKVQSAIVSEKPLSKEALASKKSDQATKAQTKTTEELFLSITAGETSDIVKAKLGKPNRMIQHKANLFNQRPEKRDFIYDDLGTIRFTVSGKELYVERVTPLIQASSDDDSFENQLKSSGTTLQAVARQYYAEDSLSNEKLDKIASVIWEQRNTEDNYTVDAISWLCKVIGKQENSRYKKIMSEVAKTSRSSKIRKYASNALKSMPDQDVDQFIYNSK